MQLQFKIHQPGSGAIKLTTNMMDDKRINTTSSSSLIASLNPPLVQNRSFLHGNDPISDKFVTLDSLALKRASLPLQLVPTVIHMDDDVVDEIPDVLEIEPSTIQQTKQSNLQRVHSIALQKETSGPELTTNQMQLINCSSDDRADDIPRNPPKAFNNATNNEGIDLDSQKCKETPVSWKETTITKIAQKTSTQQNKAMKRRNSSVANAKYIVKPKPKWLFASKVLHYVPNRGKRKKKIFKTHIKTIGKEHKSTNERPSRNVSSPTDFVHVAGITRWSWLDGSDSRTSTNSPRIITHEEKCATLTLIGDQLNYDEDDYNANSSLETLVEESINVSLQQLSTSPTENMNDAMDFATEDKPALSKPKANHSFLWSQIAKCSSDTKHNDKFDDDQNDCFNKVYDDVGPPSLSGNNSVDEDDGIYDDVGSPSTSHTNEPMHSIDHDKSDNDQLYDDVMPLETLNSKGEDDIERIELRKKIGILSIGLTPPGRDEEHAENDADIYIGINYTTVDGDAHDEDTFYDDVIVPCESRVNSIYAGSTDAPCHFEHSKESEWEDVDEYFSCSDSPNANCNIRSSPSLRSAADLHCTSSRRRSGQKWTKKVRRQKSKASRQNSTRTSNQLIRQSCHSSVAVSLGTGSVLLVGPATDEAISKLDKVNCRTNNHGDEDNQKLFTTSIFQQTHGLVQLRVVNHDEPSMDTQETSCYVLEGVVDGDSAANTESDDSNYETLCSHGPTRTPSDNVINDSEHQNRNFIIHETKTKIIIPEPPSRSIPMPPRESTLTETFGKRMKMLRRTWSITKGSLGRMRRRTSVPTTETDTNVDEACQKTALNNDNHSLDTRKSSQVFNFKKHFQRSINSLSTFYLDNENHLRSSKNNDTSIEDIYGNSNWYAPPCYTSRADSNTDDYNMLSEEPLYQFYAAATVRGAFQSDSDNYDETGNLKNSPSTSELTRPGHRTLWCQTPQVMNSNLLEQLTPDEKKIQEAKFEILTSEASYLNSLRVLVNEYVINHELVYDTLTISEREKLFGNVPSVLIASERLLAELESTWRADAMLRGLPHILLQHAERCSKVYIEYCSNQVSIDLTLKELRSKKSSKFIETVTRIEAHPASQSLSLHSFLMLPMQRVTRLPLLADAVLSKLSTDHEERLQWENVLSILSRVVTECNEAARLAGRQIEMENLSKKIGYSPKVPPIDLHDRYLVRSGPVTQIMAKPGSEYVLTFRKKYSKTPLHLLLLTDHLLIARLKPSGTQEDTYLIIDSCKRSLVALERMPDDSPFAGRHSMILTLLENYSGRNIEYILSCDSATDRERWLDAVSPPKTDTVGETLYETWDCPQVMALYSYAPCQPDELSLQPGDVINVLRKLPDGWNVGEKLVGGEQGWFPDNFTKEVASEHVRARNLRQRHRLLALSECLVQQRAKHLSSINR